MAKKQQDNEEEEKTPVTAYLPDELLAQVDENARRDRRSRSAEVVVLLEEAMSARTVAAK